MDCDPYWRRTGVGLLLSLRRLTPQAAASRAPTFPSAAARRCCKSPMLLLFTSILLLSLANAVPLLRPNSSLPLFADPDSVAADLHRTVEASHRRALSSSSCLTGNPIDDCWRCDPNWSSNRQRLADCGIGFGRGALGGKNGQIYVVTDSSDSDPVTPKPGTLRYAVIQDDPLWITFSSSMTIRLSEELIVNSFKTIDGRGANVHVTGAGCITLQYVSNVIIHNIHIHNCVPAGNANVRSSPTHVGYRSKSDGDGISIYGSRKIWIDHCSLSHCADGLVDAIMGSTGITVSNSYFAHHNDVMLLGHSDEYEPDRGMQVTIAFNYFGPELVQRMPRCRLGYFHIVNNDFSGWEMYAIGGSAAPTINSQGNRYTAPADPSAKVVTKRVDTEDGTWGRWDWRSDGDVLVNGAVFVPSGGGAGVQYAKAASVEPKSAGMVSQLTMNAGVLGGGARDDGSGGGSSYSGGSGGGTPTYTGGGEGASFSGYLGMIYGGRGGASSALPLASHDLVLPLLLLLMCCCLIFSSHQTF